MCEILLAYTTY